MQIEEIMNNKEMKPKEKTELLCRSILDKSLPLSQLLAFAEKAKDPVKATCLEALESATRIQVDIADQHVWAFAIRSLEAEAPRVKWESAKVLGNIARLFPDRLGAAIPLLIGNAGHKGTVVRWSAAFALGEIVKIRSLYQKEAVAAADAICAREEKNSIRKIYQDVLRKYGKI